MTRTRLAIMTVIASGFLVWQAGTWAFAFYRILRDGYVEFYGPSIAILITEFALAIALTLTGIVFITWVVVKKRKRR